MALVRISDRALEDLEALPLTVQQRVWAVIDRLERWPRVSGVKWLTGPWKQHARIRTGDYRVVFTVEGQTVSIVRVAHRREVYE